MANWLSEEMDQSEANLESLAETVNRMARALRELARYVKAVHALENAVIDFNPIGIEGKRKEAEAAWKGLSDDAKELLGDIEEEGK